MGRIRGTVSIEERKPKYYIRRKNGWDVYLTESRYG
jgi:hypothetical protein